MNKSLKQIADELGIDKQKVYRFVKKANIKEALESTTTKLYDETAQNTIKKHFLEKTISRCEYQNHSNDMVYETLLKQLEIKDKQIEELMRSLQFEQGKTKELQEKIFAIEAKSDSSETVKEPENETKTKKWFKFF